MNLKKTLSVLILALMLFGSLTGSIVFATENPNSISADKSVVQVVTGPNNAACILDDGSLYVWGLNTYGQIGIGCTTAFYTPIKLMDGVESVAFGENHMLILEKNGSIYAAGLNDHGQLGSGDQQNSSILVKVLSGAKAIAAKGNRSFALMNDSIVYSWGEFTEKSGNSVDYLNPEPILDNVKEFRINSCENTNSYAFIKNDNSLWLLGSSYLFIDSSTSIPNFFSEPEQVFEEVKDFKTGTYAGLILKTDGSLYSYGYDSAGELGLGHNGYSDPSLILSDVQEIDMIHNTAGALKTDGSLWLWGNNSYSNVCSVLNQSINIPLKILTDVRQFSLGSITSYALLNDNSLWIWGSNLYGQFGNGTYTDSNIPINCHTNISFFKTNNNACFAVDTNGLISVWGNNENTKLGIPNLSQSTVPITLGFSTSESSIDQNPDQETPDEPSDTPDDSNGSDERDLQLGDVNGDGKINSSDALQILRYAVKEIDHF